MKIRNLLSTLVLAASISVPMLVTNTANAGDRYYNNGHGRSDYRHGYRDGYRDSSDDDHYYRRRGHGYSNYGYAPHVGLVLGYGGGHGGGHGYRRGHGGGHGGGHSSLGFLFNF